MAAARPDLSGVPEPGERIAGGKYEVERLIGVGGMGAVVVARRSRVFLWVDVQRRRALVAVSHEGHDKPGVRSIGCIPGGELTDGVDRNAAPAEVVFDPIRVAEPAGVVGANVNEDAIPAVVEKFANQPLLGALRKLLQPEPGGRHLHDVVLDHGSPAGPEQN